MKKKMTAVMVAVVLTTGLASAQEVPEMKMTTEIPEGIATPDNMETAIGTLTSVDGVPVPESTQRVYDNLDLNHATEAFLNGLPIASMYAMNKSYLEFGPANTTSNHF